MDDLLKTNTPEVEKPVEEKVETKEDVIVHEDKVPSNNDISDDQFFDDFFDD